MHAYYLFALIIFGVFALFIRSRKSLEKRHWTNQTTGEKILLSLALAGIFQFFTLVGIFKLLFLPGWIVAVSIFGYSDGTKDTALDNFLFGIVGFTANTLIYSPFIYLILKGLFGLYRKRQSLS